MNEEETNNKMDPYKLRELGFELFLRFIKEKGGGFEGFLNEYLLQAIAYYEQLVKILPDFYFDWTELGLFYLAAFFNLTRAKECFKKALELKPDFDKALYHLGTVYEMSGKDREKGFECKLKAVALSPQSSEGWIRLAESYILREEREKAIVCYEKSLELNPENPVAKSGLYSVLNE